MSTIDLGPYHPIVVHFAIGLLAAGVVLRWLSLTGRLAGRRTRSWITSSGAC